MTKHKNAAAAAAPEEKEEAEMLVPPPSEPESEVSIANKQNNDDELNQKLAFNAIYYILFFAIIGLPVWYFTTTTYRAALPYDHVNAIFESMQTGQFRINLELVVLADDLKSNSAHGLNSKLVEILNQNQEDQVQFVFRSQVRKPSAKEVEAVKASSSIEELDAKLHRTSCSPIRIYVLTSEIAAARFNLATPDDYYFLDSLYVSEANADVKKLAKLIKTEFLDLAKVSHNYEAVLNNERDFGTSQAGQNKEKIRANFDPNYEITFSLLNERPDLVNGWSIETSIETYFKRLIEPLAVYVNFSLKAQTLLFSDFSSYKLQPMSRSGGAGDKAYFIKSSDLSIMTNFIENRLGARVSDASAFEFVTYVAAKQPLYILADANNVQTNAFLVPRWGGIYIHNVDVSTTPQTIATDVDMRTFMTHFLDLIGIRLNKNVKEFARNGIYSSEIYAYLLEKTLENQASSINTLKSLSLLLIKINSMVIEDHIAQHFKIACDSLDESLERLRQGDLEQAFRHSKLAFINSEKVFFDKSLLEKLYFPEDQRFAIYVPLFIPVGIPLLLSTKYIMKWIKLRKTTRND